MKKTILIFAIAAATAVSAAATEQWTLQGNAYSVDTVYYAKIGPGTTQTTLQLTGSSNLMVYYTTTDLTDEHADIRVLKGNNRVGGSALEKLSSMTERNSREGARYFAGINADFFNWNSGLSEGPVVVDNEIFYGRPVNFVVNWHMDNDKKPHFGNFVLTGNVTFSPADASLGERTFELGGVNSAPQGSSFIVFTERNPDKAGVNADGTNDIAVVPVEGSLSYNGTVRCRVVTPATSENITVPEGGFMLSAVLGRQDRRYFEKLVAGDIVTITTTSQFDGNGIAQMACGRPRLLKDGVIQKADIDNLAAGEALGHLKNNEPRTAIGLNADATKVTLLVVDGRRSQSVGCTGWLLADIISHVGCTDAMNFDGGGSSELYTTPLGIRNRPTDGTERAVVNGVWAVSTAPDDDNIAAVAFADRNLTIDALKQYTPTIYAYNQYGVLIDTDVKDYTLSCPSVLGTISDDGKTFTATGSGYHALTVNVGGHTATIAVTVNGNGGIGDITAGDDSDKPVEYYNLSGVRISGDTLAPGIYIRRQGTKVEKITVK